MSKNINPSIKYEISGNHNFSLQVQITNHPIYSI